MGRRPIRVRLEIFLGNEAWKSVMWWENCCSRCLRGCRKGKQAERKQRTVQAESISMRDKVIVVLVQTARSLDSVRGVAPSGHWTASIAKRKSPPPNGDPQQGGDWGSTVPVALQLLHSSPLPWPYLPGCQLPAPGLCHVPIAGATAGDAQQRQLQLWHRAAGRGWSCHLTSQSGSTPLLHQFPHAVVWSQLSRSPTVRIQATRWVWPPWFRW